MFLEEMMTANLENQIEQLKAKLLQFKERLSNHHRKKVCVYPFLKNSRDKENGRSTWSFAVNQGREAKTSPITI